MLTVNAWRVHSDTVDGVRVRIEAPGYARDVTNNIHPGEDWTAEEYTERLSRLAGVMASDAVKRYRSTLE